MTTKVQKITKTGKKVGRPRKDAPTDKSKADMFISMAVERARRIQSDIAKGNHVKPDDKKWLKAYGLNLLANARAKQIELAIKKHEENGHPLTCTPEDIEWLENRKQNNGETVQVPKPKPEPIKEPSNGKVKTAPINGNVDGLLKTYKELQIGKAKIKQEHPPRQDELTDEEFLSRLNDKSRHNHYLDAEKPQIALGLFNKHGEFDILGTLNSSILISGKAKAKKSFLMQILAAAALSDYPVLGFHNRLPDDKKNILYFDTEQSEYHCTLVSNRIIKLSNAGSDDEKISRFIMYDLRDYSTHEIKRAVKLLIENTPNLGIVFIDGIKDLVTSINDEEQANEISRNVLKWGKQKNVCVVSVLHQNKTDTNVRGHIGTELMNKSDTVLSVELIADNKEVSMVIPTQTRNKPPEDFYFEIINNLPVNIAASDTRLKRQYETIRLHTYSLAKTHRLLLDIFNNKEQISNTELVDNIKDYLDKNKIRPYGKSAINDYIKHWLEQGYLIKEDKKNGLYKLGDFNES